MPPNPESVLAAASRDAVLALVRATRLRDHEAIAAAVGGLLKASVAYCRATDPDEALRRAVSRL